MKDKWMIKNMRCARRQRVRLPAELQGRTRAAALLLVLGVIVVMSLAITVTFHLVLHGADLNIGRNESLRAIQLAEKGIAIATNPVVKKYDPLLNQMSEQQGGFRVRIESEGKALNVNALLLGEDVQPLIELFTLWGMEFDKATILADHLSDWVDRDDLQRLNGMEKDDYEELGMLGFPLNHSFYSLEEMGMVAGMEEIEVLKPDWRDSFTLWSGGRLDLNDAPAELIAAVTGEELSSAERLVEARAGDDGQEGTEDDLELASVEEAFAIMAVSAEKLSILSKRVSIADPTIRITSTGQAGQTSRTVIVIVRNRDSQPVMLQRIQK